MTSKRKTDKIINLISVFLFFISFLGIVYLTFDNKPKPGKNIDLGVRKTIVRKTVLTKVVPPSYFRIPILVYHYVEIVQNPKDTIRESLNTPPKVFENQLKTFINNGYQFVTLSDISDYLNGKKAIPKHVVALTFDDGYRDFYTYVFPILKKYHAKATAYIVPGFINKQNNLTSFQLQQIVDSGLVEIGDHTIDHTSLTSMSHNDAWYEIYQSKIELENTYNINIESFSYPYGSFNSSIINLVQQAGFKTAVSTRPGNIVDPKDRYYLFRIHPGYLSGDRLLSYIESNFITGKKLAKK